MGPYMLLALLVPIAWVTKSGKIMWAFAALLTLFLGVPMAQQGSVKCCAAGQMLTGYIALLFYQYTFSLIGVIAVLMGWLLFLVKKETKG